jgi:hypothetical protein
MDGAVIQDGQRLEMSMGYDVGVTDYDIVLDHNFKVFE